MPKKILRNLLLSFKILARILVAGIILLSVVLWLGSKFWLFPNIEHYHEDITAIASQVANQPITIGKIQADWPGIRPRLIFNDVRILDNKGRTTLSFQRIENVLSWSTLITRQFRLHSLEIQNPDLHIRRDLLGKIHVANFPIKSEAAKQVTDSNVLDMILHPSHIVVSDARITWEDEFNTAPALLFEHVNLLIDNDGSRHRFAVRAQPPVHLSTNLDVRGDFYGDSFADPKAWYGQAYTQLNYANIPAWKPWLPTAGVIKRGKGAMRGWMDVQAGQLFRMTVDVALSDIGTQLADDALPLEMLTMRGRLVWENVSNGLEIALRKFSLKLNNGLDLQPVDFYLRLTKATDTQPASGEVRADSLELMGLVSLASFLPINSDFRQQLVDFSPSGQVTKLQAKWSGNFDRLQNLDIQAKFDNLALRRVGGIPGFSGLSGQINGNEDAGTLTLLSNNLKLNAPQIMPEPLQLDSLTAKTGWQKNDRGYAIQYENVSVENQDAAGIISGSFQTLADSPGEIDLKVNLTRALVQRTSRYIPLVALKSAGNAWVKQALLDGQSNDFSLILRGNLKKFPFDEKDSGLFQIKASAIGAAVKYHPDWPVIDQGVAKFTIQGRRLETFVSTAVTVGGHLQNVSVVMPDITSANLMLKIRGEAKGKTSHFLDFIQQSPVRGYIDEASDNITALGSGKLILSLDIPLPDVANTAATSTSAAIAPTARKITAQKITASKIVESAPVEVAGNYHFIENDVTLPGGIVVQQASGHLLFTESSLRTKNVAGQVFGGPASVVLQRKLGKPLVVKAQGVAHMDQLRHGVSYPILNYLHGSIPWEANITVQPKRFNMQVTSSLLGVQFDMPVPLTKQASEQIPLNFEMQRKASQETLSLQYGKLLDAKLVRYKKKGEWLVHGGNIHFGALPEQGSSAGVIQPGIWMTGTVPELAVQGWGKLFESTGSDSALDLSSFKFKGADLLIKKISGLGYALNDVRIKASTPGQIILAKVAAPRINGEVKWQPQGKGRLTVRLTSLNLQKDPDLLSAQLARPVAETPPDQTDEQLTAGSTQTGTVLPSDPSMPGDPGMLSITGKQTFPTFDLAVDNLTWNKISWGKLELLLSKQVNRSEQIWLAERIHVATPEGVMAGEGKWIIAPDSQQTQINIGLDILNSGRLLSRLGYPDSVKDGAGRLEGKLYWQGGPQAFGVAVLDGALKLNVGKGQFLQVDPGIGKLLSVFSLQALPKRITLDFTDVFSKGFKFDQISSTAQIRQGLMQIDDFKIEGSAAKVTMRGQVDLIQETQDLRVRILPTIGDTVSLLGFAAGPAVGIGVLLANKIFRDPLDKLVSFEYNVDGTWAAPNVVKMSH